MDEYVFGKYIYLDYLVMINKLTNEKYYLECPLRYSDDKMLNYLNSILQNLMEEETYKGNLSELAVEFLNALGILWCLQPFYDGNTRTILMFAKTFLLIIGYNIDIKEVKIPIFYNEKEKATPNEVNNFLKLVKKIN